MEMGLGAVSAVKGCSLAHDTTSWHVLGPLYKKPVSAKQQNSGPIAQRCVPGARLYRLLIRLEYHSSISISLGCGTPGNNNCSLNSGCSP